MKTAQNGSRRSVRRGLAADLGAALRFSSRLPVPALPGEADPYAIPDVQRMARMLPVAGVIIGSIGGAVLAAALALGFGPWLAAALAVTALTLVTGALHEDGLADTADGFGGGATPQRRLEIMRDSRTGSFGATALILAFTLRIAAVAVIAARLDALGAAVALMHAAAASRAAQLGPLALLPSARREGASAAFGRPSLRALAAGGLVAAGLAAVLASATALPGWGVALGFGLAAGVTLGMTRLSDRLIGGQTGDVAGAVQQLAEIAVLLGLVTALRP